MKKKVISILLCLILCLSLTSTAFAASYDYYVDAGDTSVDITIPGAAEGQKFYLCSVGMDGKTEAVFDATVSSGKVTVQLPKGLEEGKELFVRIGANTYTVYVGTPEATTVTVTPGSVTLAPGATTTLNVTVTPADMNAKGVSWTSDNASVASVDSNGVVTAGTTEGTATITATANDGTTGTCTVTVKAAPPAHSHSWGTAWDSDATHHWHNCSAPGCTVTDNSKKNGYGPHVYTEDSDTTCNTCGYERTVEHTHTWAEAWSGDAASHWHECTAPDCTVTDNSQKDSYGAHVYTDEADATCNTCGYVRTVSHTHAWAETWTSDVNGHWHECTASGCTLENSQKDGYAAHISDGGKVTVPATAYTTGVWTESCTVCGYAIRTEVIPATGGYPGGGHPSGGGSSSGGNTSTGTNYSITIPAKPDHGKVSIRPSNASKGTTVTITATPDKGYEVSYVTVKDKDGNEIRVTDGGNGKYTFTMPGSKVTVEAAFVPVSGEQPTSPTTPVKPSASFKDVAASAYYYDAVQWAVSKGITNGTTATTFGPEESCTRGQIVTFLWRAAGSPTATGSNPFTDVKTGDYWYDAVLWAVSQGITNGTTATTFGPNETCTRGQTVTFLYRNAGSPAAAASSAFTDVASGAYYSSAVAWAVSQGITNGTTARIFSPDEICTRGQIVTFLYRAMGD